ncbi:hypothetical protein [Streptomyces ureilyticus]|uniref:Transposase n=1 Tax=Streptomyces ureilyticus TaxID=1775131 RepID=A0ABX0E2V1_9ACTN|nr:hypothetical protein [Streptomyces ureilyticus]NGO48535.1 hypothetical protein [Streptomyces ureilyticus]
MRLLDAKQDAWIGDLERDGKSDRRPRLAAGGWRLAAGGWRLAAGG